MEQPALGLTLAFTAGVLFGLNGALIRAGSRNVSTTLSVLISLALGTPLLLGAAVLSGQLLSLPLEGWAAYFAAGILSFVVGRGLYYYSITLLGATSASIIVTPTTILSAILAWIVLDEEPGVRIVGALGLTVLAVYLAGSRPSGVTRDNRPGYRLRGILGATTAVVAFAGSTILVRYGGAAFHAPLAGIFASYLVALAIVTPYAYMRGAIVEFRVVDRRSLLYIVVAGVAVVFAQMSRYVALSLIEVAPTVVLISLFPLHTAFFTVFFSEADEKPGKRHLAATLASVIAVYLVSTA